MRFRNKIAALKILRVVWKVKIWYVFSVKSPFSNLSNCCFILCSFCYSHLTLGLSGVIWRSVVTVMVMVTKELGHPYQTSNKLTSALKNVIPVTRTLTVFWLKEEEPLFARYEISLLLFTDANRKSKMSLVRCIEKSSMAPTSTWSWLAIVGRVQLQDRLQKFTSTTHVRCIHTPCSTHNTFCLAPFCSSRSLLYLLLSPCSPDIFFMFVRFSIESVPPPSVSTYKVIVPAFLSSFLLAISNLNHYRLYPIVFVNDFAFY